MIYNTYGEFDVPCGNVKAGKRLDASPNALKDFWVKVDQKRSGLSEARGCYIFAIRAGKGIKPWYVGQSKGPFKKECFQPHKIVHYNKVLSNTAKGTPILLLVVRLTDQRKISKRQLPRVEADFVEQLLIGHALSANKGLINKKNTKFLKELRVPGVLNSPPGNLRKEAELLRFVLGIK